MRKPIEFSEKKKTDNQENRNRIEYCCLCGTRTEYTFDIPVQERQNYIVGIGQLCQSCARKLEKESRGIYVEDY